jgi:hypothetical protein
MVICRGNPNCDFVANVHGCNGKNVEAFYLYAIKKDGADLCATKQFARTCVPST